MSTEYKLGAAAVGLIVLLGTIFMFANQPKNEKSGLPFEKGGVGAPKTAADKTVTPAPAGGTSARPTAPAIPTAKHNPPSGKTNSGTSIESPVSPPKSDNILPPVATAPPARRAPEATTETPAIKGPESPAGSNGSGSPPPGTGTGSPTPGNSGTSTPGNSTLGNPTPGTTTPGLTHAPSNSPTVSTPTTGDPGRPTGTPAPGGSTPGGSGTSPPKPDNSKPSTAGKPTVYDTEIERSPTSVADLSGRSSPVRSNSTDPRSGITPGDKPLNPGGRSTDASRTPPSDSKPLPGKPYTVQPGDRLSAIAREKYGDASYISLIKQANPGLNENRIIAGATIILPDGPGGSSGTTPSTAAKPEKPAKPEPGKTEPTKPALTKSDATKPDPAKPDATLAHSGGDKTNGNGKRDGTAKPTAPAKPETAAKDVPAGGGGPYVVRRGDTLQKIAKSKLNDGNRWREILALNKDKLPSADALEIGMTLRLPESEKSTAEKSGGDSKPRSRPR